MLDRISTKALLKALDQVVRYPRLVEVASTLSSRRGKVIPHDDFGGFGDTLKVSIHKLRKMGMRIETADGYGYIAPKTELCSEADRTPWVAPRRPGRPLKMRAA